MLERKVYRFRIDPTAEQEAALARYAGAARGMIEIITQPKTSETKVSVFSSR